MNAITISPCVEQLPPLPKADLDRVANFARQDKSPATRAAYRSDFSNLPHWCASRGVNALPATPETVAGFLAAQAEAGLAASTISRRGAMLNPELAQKVIAALDAELARRRWWAADGSGFQELADCLGRELDELEEEFRSGELDVDDSSFNE